MIASLNSQHAKKQKNFGMSYKQYIGRDGITHPSIFSVVYWKEWFIHSEEFQIRKYLNFLRSEEYYTFIRPNRILRIWYKRKKNILGGKLGIIIHAGNFDEQLKIYHIGSIIVHPKARIGKGCIIHGNCCIGSDGGFPDIPPRIGDHVDIGQGAQILGDIDIAAQVKIGAGAVVVKSVNQPGVTLVGVPAQILNKPNY